MSNKSMVSVLIGMAMDAALYGNNYQQAMDFLNEALEHDPNSGEIYHNRGMVHKIYNYWRAAISDFGRAIKLSPHPSSYEQRGIAYYHIGDPDSAFKDWQKALEMDPSRTLALINLAWLAIEAKEFLVAIQLSSHAIAIDPTCAKAYENRARAYLEMGELSRGLIDLETAKELIHSGHDTSHAQPIE